MLTNNGIRAIAMLLTSGGRVNTTRAEVFSVSNEKMYAAVTNNGTGWPQNCGDFFISTLGTNIGVCIGSGDTPVDVNDYKLDNAFSSGFTGAVSKMNSDTEDAMSLKLAVAIQNKSDSPMTIREIGLIQTFRTASTVNSTPTTNTYCLVERTVLDVPVVIAAGESETIDYTIAVDI